MNIMWVGLQHVYVEIITLIPSFTLTNDVCSHLLPSFITWVNQSLKICQVYYACFSEVFGVSPDLNTQVSTTEDIYCYKLLLIP